MVVENENSIVASLDKQMVAENAPPILLFDGQCHFCNGTVNFVLARERNAAIQFVPLQTVLGRSILEHFQLPTDSMDTLVFVEHGRASLRSTGALKVCRYLKPPWSWARWAIWVPSVVRDLFYRIVARNRYRWFGKSETCQVPKPEHRNRFLGSI